MSRPLQPVRGTHDLLPKDYGRFLAIAQIIQKTVSYYGFEPMATPIFEFTEVFHAVGESSDIVTKETYTFLDRGGESITLRPEGTAAIARAVVSNGLTQNLPLKFYSEGPMFRYERPQKGRQRQFLQSSVEFFGPRTPLIDAEIIAMGSHVIKELGLQDQVQLQLNSLGDSQSRDQYRAKLVDYFEKYRSDLSTDSQERLEKNPLRILDSKDKGDQSLLEGAPVFENSLTPEARTFFEEVCEILENLGVAYTLNSRLVRGLDYYCHTAFEFITDSLGAQGAVLAGGRYDGLIQRFGGPEVPGVGWAAGLERLELLWKGVLEKERPVVLLPLGEKAERRCISLAQSLRQAGIYAEMTYSGNLPKRLKKAAKCDGKWAVILGDDELAADSATVRFLDEGSQESVPLSSLVPYFVEKNT